MRLCEVARQERIRKMNDDATVIFTERRDFIKPLLGDVAAEMDRAINKFPPMNTLHEGYAILLEEVDELWDLVKKKQSERPVPEVYEECIQIAAMALRIIVDCSKDGFKR
jgi:hypothetical protein